MKKNLLILATALLLLLPSCKKNKGTGNSGTVTITNELKNAQSAPFIYGFSVPEGKLVSTLTDPPNVITVFTDGDTATHVINKLFLTTSGLYNSFYKYGSYASRSDADDAFGSLKSFDTGTWTETADSLLPNQVWIYRTSDDKYAKIQITGTFSEIRKTMAYPYGECTFKWVYQPDGTKIFP
jgi:hypothetical protein